MKYKVTLNGRVYEVEVERGQAILADEYDAAAPAPAAAAPAAPVAAAPAAAPAPAPAANLAAGEPLPAPLPGTVLSIKVEQGAAVKSGQLLMIIEAMKMENEVVAPRDCTITQIVAKAGGSVNTGDVLFILG